MVLWQIWWAGIYRVEYCLGGNYIRRNFLDCNNPGGNFPGGSYPGWEFSRWEFSRWELSWMGILQVGVILGGNFLWWGFSGWELFRANYPGGNFPGESFPSTLFDKYFSNYLQIPSKYSKIGEIFLRKIQHARSKWIMLFLHNELLVYIFKCKWKRETAQFQNKNF